MLVTMGMNGTLAAPSSHFELSGVFDLSDLELCEVYCMFKIKILIYSPIFHKIAILLNLN